MLMKDGLVVPDVSAILEPDDFYRPEHKILFRVISRIFFSNKPVDILVVEQELRKSGELDKISRSYLFDILDADFTITRAEFYAETIKETSDLRKLILAAPRLSLTTLNATSFRPRRLSPTFSFPSTKFLATPKPLKNLPSATFSPITSKTTSTT